METIYANQLQPEIQKFLDELTQTVDDKSFVNSYGQKFVMVPEKEYRSWHETAYLLSSKKNAKLLKEALSQPFSECRDLKDVLNDLES